MLSQKGGQTMFSGNKSGSIRSASSPENDIVAADSAERQHVSSLVSIPVQQASIFHNQNAQPYRIQSELKNPYLQNSFPSLEFSLFPVYCSPGIGFLLTS